MASGRIENINPGFAWPAILRDRKTLDRIAVLGTAILALAIFSSTLQLDINGSRSHYATDVGEIQNALPRWGIIHFNGYPLYSMLGSAFVSILHLCGLAPAAGASLFSAIWAAISIGLMVKLALFYDVPRLAATVCALLLALSASVWIDASIAEVHTMMIALILATLLPFLRFSLYGQPTDLLWAVFMTGQMIAHQPATALLSPALIVLLLPRWNICWHLPWRTKLAACGLFVLGPLTYLYLPIRVWQGADWVFGTPHTWEGFRSLALDNKSYILSWPQTIGQWLSQVRRALNLLTEDWPLFLLIPGLLGLLTIASKKRWYETIALNLVWVPYLILAAMIWEGRVSDALLAAKLPILLMAALGLALLTGTLLTQLRWLGYAAVAFCVITAGWLYIDRRPRVLEITRDPEARAIIEMAEQIHPAPDRQPVTLVALWGVDYWVLAYAQKYQGAFPEIRLVKHDADLGGILARGEHLVTLKHTFYAWPVSMWETRLGRIYLSSFAPDIIEMSTHPLLQAADVPPKNELSLNNGITIRHADLVWTAPNHLLLTVYWQAEQSGLQDYSVAVHLVSRDPPTGPQDILVQADRNHPIWGWYPLSRWTAGEIVRDHHPIGVPDGSNPQAVRLGMYRSLGNGQFENTEWLSVIVPPRPE